MEQINVCCICAEVETEADGCARVICGALQAFNDGRKE